MKYKNLLGTGALITSLALSGCKPEYSSNSTSSKDTIMLTNENVLEGIVYAFEGTVINEFGTAQSYANGSGVAGEVNYGLVLQVSNQVYTLAVNPCAGKPLIALAQAIEKGDRVRIVKGEYIPGFKVSSDNIGFVNSESIIVIPRQNPERSY